MVEIVDVNTLKSLVPFSLFFESLNIKLNYFSHNFEAGHKCVERGDGLS